MWFINTITSFIEMFPTCLELLDFEDIIVRTVTFSLDHVVPGLPGTSLCYVGIQNAFPQFTLNMVS